MQIEKLLDCIEACQACATACENCATQCLRKKDVNAMARCIELDRQCSLTCLAAAQLMSMGGEFSGILCGPCAEICDACAEECGKHDMQHCQECAEACRQCAEECRRMVSELA
jgi:hypothetical protein